MGLSRLFGRFLAATTVTSLALTQAPSAMAAEADQVEFSVTNITDFHGHLEEDDYNKELGAAKLYSLVKQVNQGQEYVMTTSGDNVGGSAYVSAVDGDKYTLEALNLFDIKASAVGNHEFDKGTKDLINRIIPESNYPILGANVTENGAPLLESSKVVEVNGVRVGFVGTVTTNTAGKVNPGLIPGVEFSDPVAATNAEAKKLKESGSADIIVALMHEDAGQLAPRFSDDVDIVFGGDTHVRTSGRDDRPSGHSLVWAQGFEYGKILNDVDIVYDTAEKKIISANLKQYTYEDGKDLSPNPQVEAVVARARASADAAGKVVIGEMPRPLFRGSDEGKGSGTNRGVESTLNNFIAQAQLVQMEQFSGKDIDLAVMNAGGVRADLPQGEITNQDVFTVQPFGNGLSYAEISGAHLVKAFENQWKDGAEGRPRLAMGVSNNVQVIYDPTAKPGSRITRVTIDGKPVEAGQTYTIALSEFLAAGGDGYFEEGSLQRVSNVGLPDLDAFKAYILNENKEFRDGQGQIGIHVSGEVKPGETVSVDLSSLNYTTEGEPMAKTVTVKLGDLSQTADIDMTKQDGDDQFGERGRARVSFDLPADFDTSNPVLEVTTDAGTKATLPLPAADTMPGDNTGSSTDSGSSTQTKPDTDKGSSDKVGPGVGIAVGVVASVLAGIAGLLHFAPQLLPAPLRKMVEDLCHKMGL
ncbi:5'-nucleotidase [Corynebacterium phocae]|uniref:5'-nucleotidase n=1 Tax=Corynebacterium phocae TaxID=161895 RepID=A0A1L7D2S0_9CORY|nr:bifunctional UDP-sugar hydrolase/5'-nucleotidase [Corynebacterium phocae]APT92424.1 5'-nucleotidase [Corynebacterium phocae]KAA8725024.1 bifunctional metallophosphatase/5'-nucleotidase [Corynebacterium phocae]